MGIYINDIDMPKENEILQIRIYDDGKISRVYDIECQQIGTAIETPNELAMCKDCRHGWYDDDIEYYTCRHPKGLHGELYGVDFCSYGKVKRREK